MSEIINDLTDKIYEGIANRVLNKKNESGLSRKKIVYDENSESPYSSVQLLSCIMHKKIYKTRNPYLLTPTLSKNIVKNLKFPSKYSLIWGNIEDKDTQKTFKTFFLAGLKYLYPKYPHTISKTLMMYFDYSYAKGVYDYMSNFTSDTHEVKNRCKVTETEAMHLFVKKHFDELYTIHHNFFKEKNTSKFNKEIKNFYDTLFLSFCKNHINNNGVQLYNLTKQMLKFEDIPLYNLQNDIEEANKELGGEYKITESEKAINEITKKGKEYINSILQYQNYLQ